MLLIYSVTKRVRRLTSFVDHEVIVAIDKILKSAHLGFRWLHEHVEMSELEHRLLA